MALVFFTKIPYTISMEKKHNVFFCSFISIFIALSLFFPANATDEIPPAYRALLVACDQFLTAQETTPIGQNNLDLVQSILEQDLRGYSIKRQYGIIFSKESLRNAIQWALGDARDGDVSLLYICTHGEFDTSKNNPEGYLLLSDGALEDQISAQELNAMLDEVKGTKVLLVDACNSGALIGKGVSPDIGSARVMRMFQSGDYKVLTSSGASEPSWYWQSTLDEAPPGNSYFTTALALGAGFLGEFAADANRDGVITLKEMYDHLWINEASSAIQMYPQDDPFPLLIYDRELAGKDDRGELNGFVFQDTWLDQSRPILTFSYTAKKHTRVAYHITYQKNGKWDWDNSFTLADVTEYDGDMDPTGDISPGRKQIAIDLTDQLPENWTYALIHVMTLGDQDSDRLPFVYASRVFSAKIEDVNPELSVEVSSTWRRNHKFELDIFVKHMIPISLTVSILDESSRIVRHLAISQPTRPQSLIPSGSQFYWNGEDKGGVFVPPGKYQVVTTTRVGEAFYKASTWVTVD